LLGRFRAVPDANRQGSRSHRNSFLGSLNVGSFARYGTSFRSSNGNDSDNADLLDTEDMGALRRWGRTQRDLWLEPKQAAVGKLVDNWWTRWAVLALLPAVLVSTLSISSNLLIGIKY